MSLAMLLSLCTSSYLLPSPHTYSNSISVYLVSSMRSPRTRLIAATERLNRRFYTAAVFSFYSSVVIIIGDGSFV